MKHKLVNQLRAENKRLKAKVRKLEAEKAKWTRENLGADVEGLIKHFKRNKYS